MEQIEKSESVETFRKRKGVVLKTRDGRVTTGTTGTSRAVGKEIGSGYIYSIGKQRIPKKATVKEVQRFLAKCPPHSRIVEIYPTRFCSNPRCKATSWTFHIFERQGHSTCTKCGTVNKLIQNHMDSRHLNDSEKVNKSMWNHSPGMDANDCTIINKKGKPLQIGVQRIKSHQRHYWSCRTIIDDIAGTWRFSAVEHIAKIAKMKCKKFYYIIHNGSHDDNNFKMPHGKAQFSAACFYAAVLEFEQTRHIKTVCTLVAIQETANWYVDLKRGRQTREVTVEIIIRYTVLLKRYNLCSAVIPDINADTLRFESENTSKEHTRLAIFNKCAPTEIHLPTKNAWGLQIGNTNKGVLYVESVVGDSAAFKAGIRKGDYFFQVEENNIGVEFTSVSFQLFVSELKQKLQHKPYIKVNIMREKK